MNRRLIKLALPLTMASLVLVACGDDDEGGTDTGGTGGDKPTYTIAYQGPLTGGNRALGINEENGVELAVEQAQASGDLPFNLEFTSEDDKGTPQGSPPAARKLFGNQDVIAIVGPAFSGASIAGGPLYDRAGILAVSPSATLPDITEKYDFKNYYRAVATDNAQGPPDADYMVNVLEAKSIFVIDDTTDYGTGLLRAFRGQIEQNGGNIVGSDSAPQTGGCAEGATGSAAQYPSIAQKVVNADADAVFYAGYYCDFALLSKALDSNGFEGLKFSGDGSKDDQYIEQAGARVAEGAYLSCQCSDAASNEDAAEFNQAYQDKFGQAPGAYSVESFDVANSIIEVMKGIGADVSRQALIDAYDSVDYPGLTKQIKFNDNHDLEVQTAFLYQVKGGKFEYLGDLTELTAG